MSGRIYASGEEARVGDQVSADSLKGTVVRLSIGPETQEALQRHGAMPSDPDSYFESHIGVWRFDRCRLISRKER